MEEEPQQFGVFLAQSLSQLLLASFLLFLRHLVPHHLLEDLLIVVKYALELSHTFLGSEAIEGR